MCFGAPPEHALWALVEEGVLEYTLVAPSLFRRGAGERA